jgi:anthranilate/para-aminobenzoate synthase component I
VVVGFLLPVESAMKAPFDIAADLDTPVSAYLKLAPFRPRFLLESVEGGERLARYSFIGFGECLEVKIGAEGASIGGVIGPRPQNRDEFLIPPMMPCATSSAYRAAVSMRRQRRMLTTSRRNRYWYSII